MIESHGVIRERFRGAVMVPGSLSGWTMPSGSKRAKAHGDGWLLVGDAASLIDPFTGEGVGNALYSGKLAAEAVSEAFRRGDFGESQLSSYEYSLRSELDPELRSNYGIQKRIRSRRFINLFVRKALRNRGIRDFMAATLTDVSARKKYASLGMYLRILLTPPYW